MVPPGRDVDRDPVAHVELLVIADLVPGAVVDQEHPEDAGSGREAVGAGPGLEQALEPETAGVGHFGIFAEGGVVQGEIHNDGALGHAPPEPSLYRGRVAFGFDGHLLPGGRRVRLVDVPSPVGGQEPRDSPPRRRVRQQFLAGGGVAGADQVGFEGVGEMLTVGGSGHSNGHPTSIERLEGSAKAGSSSSTPARPPSLPSRLRDF